MTGYDNHNSRQFLTKESIVNLENKETKKYDP